jgi:MHS family proline/betaine transporter-like MFS transporter
MPVKSLGKSELNLTVFNAVTFYVGFVYLVSWLQTADGIPPSRSLEINTFSYLGLPIGR